jgi:hypothetical protein
MGQACPTCRLAPVNPMSRLDLEMITRPCRSRVRSAPARRRSFSARSAHRSCSVGSAKVRASYRTLSTAVKPYRRSRRSARLRAARSESAGRRKPWRERRGTFAAGQARISHRQRGADKPLAVCSNLWYLFFRCPRCGNRFFMTPRMNSAFTECVHCGLKRGATFEQSLAGLRGAAVAKLEK